MTQYVDIHMTLKQAVAARAALVNAQERAAQHLDLLQPHGAKWEQEALFMLLLRMSEGIREGEENAAKFG